MSVDKGTKKTKEILYKKNRMKKRFFQCHGADIYKKLQNIELIVKDHDFWQPKNKYRDVQKMVKEYEQEQFETNKIYEKDRFDQGTLTLRWVCDKKEKEIEKENVAKARQRKFDLMFVHAEHLKKYGRKKWVLLEPIFNNFFKSNKR